jgi:hypothetical protein
VHLEDGEVCMRRRRRRPVGHRDRVNVGAVRVGDAARRA